MWNSYPSLLRENLHNCDYSPIMGHLPNYVGFDYTISLPLLPILLIWKTFSARLQITPIDGCSVSSYNCDMPVGEGKLRVSLLCYLGHLQK